VRRRDATGCAAGVGRGPCHLSGTAGWAVACLALWVWAVAGCSATTAERGAAPAFTGFSLAEPGTMPAEVRLRLHRAGSHLLLPMAVDGEPVGLALFDTGSSLSVIDTGIAGRLGLKRKGGGQTVGIAGVESFAFHPVRLCVLGRGAAALAVPVDRLAGLDMARLTRSLGSGIGGLIGYTAFDGAPITIDYGRATLTVHDPGRFTPPPDTHAERLYHVRGLPVVAAEVGDGRRVLLILDSGADNELTLPAWTLRRWPELASVPTTGAGRSRGVGGTVDNTQTWLGKMRLFGQPLYDVPVAFEPAPLSLRNTPVPIGRVGGSLLKHAVVTLVPGEGPEGAGGRVYVRWRVPGGE